MDELTAFSFKFKKKNFKPKKSVTKNATEKINNKKKFMIHQQKK